MSYKVDSLRELLINNTYPGRGIAVGNSPDGKYAVVVYFIMGRSVNSRNRIFKVEEDGISTEAFDPSKMKDPSLIIYHPVREFEGHLIVTNGNQTDTVRDGYKEGKSFADSLRTREFEPDGPNWTPRISAVLEKDGTYQMSILKSVDEDGSACVRYTYEYPAVNGLGHFIHTYVGDGNPIPSFEGEPERVFMGDEIESFARDVWESLNFDNKVSLYVCFMNKETGEKEVRIFNKNEEK
ncbi:MAG: IMP cyclohydrolase [Erysipelotrichaceae bacterium]|jgi:IMP cyclohydrolase|nr:IMP cyclohydrolase [Erysipelotrichaceae bacterium]